jgi:sugar-specific transcriptional regulator TrmB
MTLENILEQSGLTDKEARIYLAALELGKSSILHIADYSKVKRTTVYEIIPQLENKGMIVQSKDGKKNIYVAESPKTVLSLLKEREKRFHEALPEMMSLYNTQENRPKVFFYEGKDEVQNMYIDTIRTGKPIMNYTSIIDLYKYLDESWVREYIKLRTEAGVKTRIIAVDSLEARVWAKEAQAQLRQIKLIPVKDANFSADVQIYGNKVIMTTYKKNLFGLVVEDDNIANLQKMAFELMWAAVR